ncbi:MAG: HAD-IA family hydrolase [Phycisphaerae bacterium]
MNTKSKILPLAVIFDMDGVLVDSEPFILKAAILMFTENGLKNIHPEDFLPFVGAGENRYLGGVAEKYHFPIDIERDKKRTYDIYLDIIKNHLKPLPGVHEFIHLCRQSGKKIALASSADRRKVHGNLTEIDLPTETFDAIVAGEDVIHKKPNPEIFLTAAKKLNIDPHDCLIIEDAVNGVAAAKSAGAKCLALTTSFSREQLNNAEWFAPNLAHAPPEALSW